MDVCFVKPSAIALGGVSPYRKTILSGLRHLVAALAYAPLLVWAYPIVQMLFVMPCVVHDFENQLLPMAWCSCDMAMQFLFVS